MTGDTALLALFAEWRQALGESTRLFKEAGEVDEDDYDEAERRAESADGVTLKLGRRIVRDMPALTCEGLAAKLEIAFDETGALEDRRGRWCDDEWALWSCWQDAQRLAAGD